MSDSEYGCFTPESVVSTSSSDKEEDGRRERAVEYEGWAEAVPGICNIGYKETEASDTMKPDDTPDLRRREEIEAAKSAFEGPSTIRSFSGRETHDHNHRPKSQQDLEVLSQTTDQPLPNVLFMTDLRHTNEIKAESTNTPLQHWTDRYGPYLSPDEIRSGSWQDQDCCYIGSIKQEIFDFSDREYGGDDSLIRRVDCERIEDVIKKFSHSYRQRYEVVPAEKKQQYQWRAASANQAWHASFVDALGTFDEVPKLTIEQALTQLPEKSNPVAESENESEDVGPIREDSCRKVNPRRNHQSNEERFALDMFYGQAFAIKTKEIHQTARPKNEAKAINDSATIEEIRRDLRSEEERSTCELFLNRAFAYKLERFDDISGSKEETTTQAIEDNSKVSKDPGDLQHSSRIQLDLTTGTLSDKKINVEHQNRDHFGEEGKRLQYPPIGKTKQERSAERRLAQGEMAQTIQAFRQGRYINLRATHPHPIGHLSCRTSSCHLKTADNTAQQASKADRQVADETATLDVPISVHCHTLKKSVEQQRLQAENIFPSKSAQSHEHDKARVCPDPDVSFSTASSKSDKDAALEEISTRTYDPCSHFTIYPWAEILKQLGDHLTAFCTKATKQFLDAGIQDRHQKCKTGLTYRDLPFLECVAVVPRYKGIDRRKREAAVGFCFLMMMFSIAMVQLSDLKSRLDAGELLKKPVMDRVELHAAAIIFGSTLWVAFLSVIPGLLFTVRGSCWIGQLLIARYDSSKNAWFRYMVDDCEDIAISFGHSVLLFVGLFVAMQVQRMEEIFWWFEASVLFLASQRAKIVVMIRDVFEIINTVSWESHCHTFVDAFWICRGRFSEIGRFFRGAFHLNPLMMASILALMGSVDFLETTVSSIKTKLAAKLEVEIHQARKTDIAGRAVIPEEVTKVDDFGRGKFNEVGATRNFLIEEIAARVQSLLRGEEAKHAKRLIASFESSKNPQETDPGPTRSAGSNHQDAPRRMTTE